MIATGQNKSKAALLAIFSVAIASAQDAIVKSMSGIYPAYETVLIRTLTALPLLLILLVLFGGGFRAFRTPLLGWIILRGLVLCSAYFSFILAIAAMPIANAVAIYFTMPFFVAMLSAPLLKEHVPYYRWLAIAAAFVGVMIMERPEHGHELMPSLFALYSALGYAVGQMFGRVLSQKVDPIVITNVQNATYLLVALVLLVVVTVTGFHADGNKSLAFLTRGFVWPTPYHLALMGFMGMLSAIAAMSFTWAYKLGEASFVAPFEYTAMISAVVYGLIFFGDFPDFWKWVGMSVVVAAGLYMAAMDQRGRAHTHKTG